MQPSALIRNLKEKFQLPLPGIESHLKMVAVERMEYLAKARANLNSIQSSVLVTLYPLDNGLGTILIKRTTDSTPHSGQIGFPGGKKEDFDLTSADTALREAWEEIGLLSHHVKILGALSPLYVLPSNFTINPVVGFIEQPGTLVPNPGEVEYVIKLPLQQLREHIAFLDMEVRGYQLRKVPCFSMNGHIIWGATAMILQELLDVLYGSATS